MDDTQYRGPAYVWTWLQCQDGGWTAPVFNDDKVIADLHSNDVVEVLGPVTGIYHSDNLYVWVRLPDGRVGEMDYVNLNVDPEPKVEDIHPIHREL